MSLCKVYQVISSILCSSCDLQFLFVLYGFGFSILLQFEHSNFHPGANELELVTPLALGYRVNLRMITNLLPSWLAWGFWKLPSSLRLGRPLKQPGQYLNNIRIWCIDAYFFSAQSKVRQEFLMRCIILSWVRILQIQFCSTPTKISSLFIYPAICFPKALYMLFTLATTACIEILYELAIHDSMAYNIL